MNRSLTLTFSIFYCVFISSIYWQPNRNLSTYADNRHVKKLAYLQGAKIQVYKILAFPQIIIATNKHQVRFLRKLGFFLCLKKSILHQIEIGVLSRTNRNHHTVTGQGFDDESGLKKKKRRRRRRRERTCNFWRERS